MHLQLGSSKKTFNDAFCFLFTYLLMIFFFRDFLSVSTEHSLFRRKSASETIRRMRQEGLKRLSRDGSEISRFCFYLVRSGGSVKMKSNRP